MGPIDNEDIRDHRLTALNVMMAAVKGETPDEFLDVVKEMNATEFAALWITTCKGAAAALEVAAGDKAAAVRILEVMRTQAAAG